jgi:IstB-like ATP binding protein
MTALTTRVPAAAAMTTTIETGGLDKTLRALKLSGMLDTIDARLAQARAGELGHIEFLQVLCEDEISRRHAMSIHRRLRSARFEDQATLEGFDFAASPKLPAAQIRDLAALRWLQAGESVILYGPVGVGKSHVAQALGHLAVRHGAAVRFLKTSRALAHLAGGRADGTWHKRLSELARPAVLIPGRLRHARAHPSPGRRPLRAHHRTGRLIADPDQQQGTAGLVPAVPQPRRRRIPARPAHQQQPPALHERTQLPAQQATRPAWRHDNQADQPVKQDQGQALVNYVSNTTAQ